ncbi:hypothetical protein [Odoribacter sp. Z80]|uniref:hypothetical protein n=1 Tax=Odoribacter sp. Z80 TaxID=2304575 RepID=UPI00137B76F7|nr:hypothetical protein [Odoribacter sp. Z80]NCE73156.1 hypothetical protein [Odoribacter sp. Z80]
MKASEIDKILVRYYDGVTDEAEEKELKRFFTEEDVPAHLLAQKEIFMQLGDFSEPEIPDGLECRLSAKIDEWAICEKRTLKVNRTGQTRARWVGSIAAGLFILFSVGICLYKPYSSTMQDTCVTSEEAYVQAQKALVMLSVCLNKGVAKVESLQETTGKVQESVNKQLNRINNIKL